MLIKRLLLFVHDEYGTVLILKKGVVTHSPRARYLL